MFPAGATAKVVIREKHFCALVLWIIQWMRLALAFTIKSLVKEE